MRPFSMLANNVRPVVGVKMHTTKSTLRASSESRPSCCTAVPSPQYPVRLRFDPVCDPPLDQVRE